MTYLPKPEGWEDKTVDLEALAEILDAARGLEVDFEPTPQGRRLLESIGVVVKE